MPVYEDMTEKLNWISPVLKKAFSEGANEPTDKKLCLNNNNNEL